MTDAGSTGRTHNVDPARRAFYDRIAPKRMAPLWEVLAGLVTAEPDTQTQPHLWRYYEDVRPNLLEACQLITAEEAERRVLVLVSDGGDNASRETFASVLALAHRSQTVIYAIGLMGTPPANDDEDPRLVKRLARDTGGLSLFPRSTEDIVAAATRVAHDVREQYTLGFVPGTRSDGRTFRRIEVKVERPGLGRLRARTRSGYAVAGTP
jgi:VWFA-related protein